MVLRHVAGWCQHIEDIQEWRLEDMKIRKSDGSETRNRIRRVSREEKRRKTKERRKRRKRMTCLIDEDISKECLPLLYANER